MSDDAVLALRLVRAAAPVASPRRDAGDLADGPAGRAAIEGWQAMRRDWRAARGLLLKAQRRAQGLGSRRRRAFADHLFTLVRHERTLLRLLSEVGVSADRRDTPQLVSLAALVALAGLEPERAAELAPGIPWSELTDPAHLLTGWVLRERPTPATALAEAASVSDPFAAGVLERLEPEEAALALGALSRRAPIFLRVATSQTTRDEAIAALAEAGVRAEASPWSEAGVRLLQRVEVHTLAPVRDGRLAVQDEGSQVVAELVAAAPGEVVVDACAGAWGKALALAEAMDRRGRILACDVRPDALDRGAKRARAAGLSTVEPVRLRDERLPKKLRSLTGRADRVLVDAPCTGTGAARRQPWNRWLATRRAITDATATQAAILDRFAPLVKPGGTLVYATCSVLTAEDEKVVDAFLRRHGDFERQPTSLALGAERAERLGGPAVLRMWPHRHDTDGFFAAVLRRR